MSAQGRIARLGEHVARQEESLLRDPKEHERLRSAVVFAVARPRQASRPIWAYASGAALAAVAVVAVLLFAGRHESRIGFVVGQHRTEGTAGDFIAAGEAPLPVTFSDGTRVTLEPGARGRIASTSAAGADLVVESGRAEIAVVPRQGNRWQVSTGPFIVHVTGTRFDVEWHPERDTFVLELKEGHVRISGCAFGEGHAVQAGERVEASCERGEFRVSRLGTKAEPAGEEPPAHDADTEERDPPPTPVDAEPIRSAARNRTPAPAAAGDWLSLSREGRFREAYAAAAPRLGELEERANVTELLLLGDTARLSGHPGQARLSYLALRRRFAGSENAALAAFQIGRADFDLRADYASAEHWLDIYLREEPSGALAAPALGRLMEAEVHLERQDAARTVAERYLARFPKGPHADTARRVQSAGTPAAH